MKSILDGVTIGTTNRTDAPYLMVAKADEEKHKPVKGTAILAQAVCIDLHLTDWGDCPTGGFNSQELPSSGSLAGKYRIENTCWEARQILKRVGLFSKSRRS